MGCNHVFDLVNQVTLGFFFFFFFNPARFQSRVDSLGRVSKLYLRPIVEKDEVNFNESRIHGMCFYKCVAIIF
jgi:hypothetical protein